MAKHQIFLSDALVYKRFGRDPSRGKILPIMPTMRVTAGTKWSLPHKARIPDNDVLVRPTVALHKMPGRIKTKMTNGKPEMSLWVADVDERWWPRVSEWLTDYCR